jgi:hypothetical protein
LVTGCNAQLKLQKYTAGHETFHGPHLCREHCAFLLVSTFSQPPQEPSESQSDGSLHAVHNALFASFLPIDDLPGIDAGRLGSCGV